MAPPSCSAKVHPSDPAGVMRRANSPRTTSPTSDGLDRRLDAAGEQLERAVAATGTSVTALHGVGRISAATILAETGDIRRFPTRNHYASYAGTAPLDVLSGDVERHRVNPAWNRRLNWAIHIAAIVQIRHRLPRTRVLPTQTRRRQRPKGHPLRCLKRRITDAIYRQLRADAGLSPEPDTTNGHEPRQPSGERTDRHTHQDTLTRTNS